VSTVDEIKEQVLALSAEDQADLRDWLLELDWDRWDEQLERDVRNGKLDALAEEARREHADGKTTPR
jgi:hypothetical protein